MVAVSKIEFDRACQTVYRAAFPDTKLVGDIREITRCVQNGEEVSSKKPWRRTLRECLAYRGRCISVGQAGREGKLLDISSLGAGNQSLTGVFLGAEIATPRAQAMIGDLVDDVAAGRLEVLIDRTFPLADAAAAHAFIESRKAVGRVVLVP